MKRFFSAIFLLILISLIILMIILSTTGIETNKFNSFISNKINKFNNINLSLTTIKFKIDIEEMSLFLNTKNPEISYMNTTLPTKTVKVYIDFISFLKSKPKIKKINLVLNQLDIEQLKKISINLKPSNFTSFVNNKIKEGNINTEIEIFFDDKNLLNNFIARGSVTNLKAEIIDQINIEETYFNFFADKSDILVTNMSGKTGPIKILEGDLKINLSPEITIQSNFNTNLKYDRKVNNYENFIKNYKNIENLQNIQANLNNNFSISFDQTYKVKKYNFQTKGLISDGELSFKKPLKNFFLDKEIKSFSLSNSKIKTNFTSNQKIINISGKYSLNKGNLLSFNLDNIIKNKLSKFKIQANFDEYLDIKLINYEKKKNKIANFSINLEKLNGKINIKTMNLKDGNNSLILKDVKFDKNEFLSLKEILVKTNKNGKKNNDFSLIFGKKILVKGSQFDASNLPKFLKNKKTKNKFFKINKNIEIDFVNITAPLSEKLKNFKLIGKIENGKFSKISAKGDFGKNNFLDIMMTQNKKNKKKYLEIYSDLTRPLLTEYEFFKGLTGGKLLYTSIIDDENFNSKLKIENFNVVDAPGMVKLLSLADLGGLADLAAGEGLSFDILEIQMKKNNNVLELNEILALGPSISVIMEGYQSPNVTSLKGTLIPAKTLNTIISKIPLLGDIVIPKEAGEGLFGISFKMKGSPGKIKTTINPIRTLTPRFIQKIVDKKKIK
ncbi:hypothetical protein OAT08_00335 [Pelagibacteraceae bacterium]|nr:hypothetical protein [Pelagibacteraceae bacterium]